jgi:hypothetical protein
MEFFYNGTAKCLIEKVEQSDFNKSSIVNRHSSIWFRLARVRNPAGLEQRRISPFAFIKGISAS